MASQPPTWPLTVATATASSASCALARATAEDCSETASWAARRTAFTAASSPATFKGGKLLVMRSTELRRPAL